MNGNELTVRSENKMVSNDTWNTLYKQAAEIIKSGFLPPSIKTAAQAIAVILTGRELGIGMMEAFRGIHIIDNRPSISPQLMMSLIYNSGVAENIKIESTPTYCTVSGNRKGQPPVTAKFTTDDAKNMGLLFRDNWKKQQQNMLRWRAISAWARLACPDVICGLYLPEELENTDDAIGKGESALELSEKLNSDPAASEKYAEEIKVKILDDIRACVTTQELSHVKKQYEQDIGRLMDVDRVFILEELDHAFQNIVSDETLKEGEIEIGCDGTVKEGIKTPEIAQETPKTSTPATVLPGFDDLQAQEDYGKAFLPQAVKEIDACVTVAALNVWKTKNVNNRMKLLKDYRQYLDAYLKTAFQKKGAK